MPTAATKIDVELHQHLIQMCEKEGCSPSEYLRNLIKYDRQKTSYDTKLSVEGDYLIVPCEYCGRPVHHRLSDLGLKRAD